MPLMEIAGGIAAKMAIPATRSLLVALLTQSRSPGPGICQVPGRRRDRRQQADRSGAHGNGDAMTLTYRQACVYLAAASAFYGGIVGLASATAKRR
jgi:hypothetical protein